MNFKSRQKCVKTLESLEFEFSEVLVTDSRGAWARIQ